MKATTTDIPEVPTQIAIPAKTILRMNGNVELVGDGVKTFLQLLQDQISATTGLDDVLLTGKEAQMSIKLYIETESADLV